MPQGPGRRRAVRLRSVGPSGSEVFEAGMRELNHAPGARNEGTWGFPQHTDACVAPLLGWQIMLKLLDLRSRDAEAQLVVIPARERELARPLLSDCAHQKLGHGNPADVDLEAAVAGEREFRSVPEESIRHIDARAGMASQAFTKCEPGRGIQEALAKIAGRFLGCAETTLLERKPRRRIARSTGHEQQVSRMAAGSQQRCRLGNVTHDLHGDTQWTRGRIAAHESNIVSTRQSGETRGELLEPTLVRSRQRQGKQRPAWA